MAVYDPEARKLVVRVVYDGPGMAGKTTNLQQLCSFFTRQRRSDLYSGATTGERTLCLDWLQLDGGLVRGHELRCHLLTVPGQAVLSRRRQLLLSLADATVFVVESSEAGLEEARSMWLSMLSCTGGLESGVPVVLQANKQDRAGALSATEIRERWALDPRIPVVAAQATNGTGVRETVVLAIRSTAIQLQEKLQGNGIDELEGRYESGEELERRILDLEQANPMSAVDVVLAAHQLQDSSETAPLELSVASPGAEPAASEVTLPLAFAALSQAASLADDDAVRDHIASLNPGGTEAAKRPSSKVPERGSRLTPVAPAGVVTAPLANAAGWPVLPDNEAAHGLVWPPAEGRRTLRRIPIGDAKLRLGPAADAADAAAPSSLTFVYEAGIWCLKTQVRRCFREPDQARKELVRLAHLQMDLGKLRVPRTVLAVQADGRGRHWVWTVSLWLTTLRQQMTYAAETEDQVALASALGLYSDLAMRGFRACLENGLALEIEPEKFGVLSGEGFYLQDEVLKGAQMPAAGASLLRCFDEYERHELALAAYQRSLSHGLGSFRPGELDQLGVIQGIERAAIQTQTASDARRDLLEKVARPRGSAA